MCPAMKPAMATMHLKPKATLKATRHIVAIVDLSTAASIKPPCIYLGKVKMGNDEEIVRSSIHRPNCPGVSEESWLHSLLAFQRSTTTAVRQCSVTIHSHNHLSTLEASVSRIPACLVLRSFN